MDNCLQPGEWIDSESGEIVAELPRGEQLVRLYEQLNRLHPTRSLRVGNTAASAHYRAYGHRLARGCCAPAPEAAAGAGGQHPKPAA